MQPLRCCDIFLKFLYIKDKLINEAPTWKSIKEGNVVVKCSSEEQFVAEKKLINKFILEDNIEKLISRYPVRTTGALGLVHKAFSYKSRERYEQVVRTMLSNDYSEKEKVLKLLKPVTDHINSIEA